MKKYGISIPPQLKPFIALLKVLLVVMVFYCLLRGWFLVKNWNYCFRYYWHPDGYALAKDFLLGVYYDNAIILFVNTPVILLMLLPLPFRHHQWYKLATAFIFSLLNTIFLFAAVIDVYFYSYSLERSSGMIVSLASDFFPLFSIYARDYPMALLLIVAAAGILFFVYLKAVKKEMPAVGYHYIYLLLWPLMATAWYFSVRSVWKPQQEVSSVALNTPYVIVGSFFNDALFLITKNWKNYIISHRQRLRHW